MTVRPYAAPDAERFVALVKSGGGDRYGFPDPAYPGTLATLVLEEDGALAGAIAAVCVPEVMLVLDHELGTPAQRLARARALAEEGSRVMWRQGYRILSTPVPQEFAGWARKLQRFCGVEPDPRIHGILDLRRRFAA